MAVLTTRYSNWINENPDVVASAASRMPAPPPAEVVGVTSAADVPPPLAPYPPAQPPQEAAPVPTARPAVAPDTQNPRAALAQVQDEQIAAQGDIAQSFTREGEAKVGTAQKKADLLKADAGDAARYAAKGEAGVAENERDQTQAREWLRQDMLKLREPPLKAKAWQKATSVLSGILAGTVQGWLGPAGGGLAFGLGALDDFVQSNVRRQLEEKEAAAGRVKGTQDYLDTLSKDSDNDVDLAAKLYANHYLATAKEFEALAESAKVPEYRENALRMATEAESRGRGILEKRYGMRIAENAAAAAAKAKKVLTAKDILELERLKLQNDQLGLANDRTRAGAPMDALELERIRLQNEQLGLANDGARQKLAAGPEGGAPGPVDREVLNPRVWASLNDTEKAKFRTADAAYKAFDASTRKLEELLLEHGTESFGEVSKQMEALQADLLGSYKEIKELGALDNGVIEVVDRAIGDPTALFKGGDGVRAKIQASRAALKHGLEARAGNLGLGESSYGKPPPPDIRPRGEAAATTADADVPVPMLDKTGRRFMIPPARAAAARAAGLVDAVGATYDAPPAPPVAAPSAPTPAAPPSVNQVYSMTAAEAEENARLAQEEELVRRQLAGGP